MTRHRNIKTTLVGILLLRLGFVCGPSWADDTQASVAAPAGTMVLTVNAVGAQVYECRADAAGKLVWQFREPIATLLQNGKTIGRHFAGPSWEMNDGSRVVGKVAAKAAGATPNDIPWLKLGVLEHGGSGTLDAVSIVQRVATSGGVKSGPCSSAGSLLAEPYAADYVFSRP